MNVSIETAKGCAWRLLPFEEAVNDATSGNPKIPQKEYLSTGGLPVVDQGQQEIGGFVDDVSLKCKEELPCIVFGDHTKSIKFIDYDFALGADGVKVLVPKRNDIDKKYLYRFLQTIKLPDDAGYSRHYKFLKRAMVPLPPLDEQKRIAGILDKADAIRRKRAESLKLLDELLRATFLDMFGDPITNPKGWPKKSLESICTRIIDCPHSTPKWTSHGIICLRTSNLTVGGWNWNDTRYISQAEYIERTTRSEISAGDIILSREGTVGVAAIVPENLQVSMGQRLVQLKPNLQHVCSHYLLQFLLYELAPEKISTTMKGATSKHLNVKDLRKLSIPVPDIVFQNRFDLVAKKIKEQMHAKLSSTQYESDTLFHSLVARAFKGEL